MYPIEKTILSYASFKCNSILTSFVDSCDKLLDKSLGVCDGEGVEEGVTVGVEVGVEVGVVSEAVECRLLLLSPLLVG